MVATTLPTTLPMDLPLPRPPIFGHHEWMKEAAVTPVLPPDRSILRAARVRVNRTPLYEIVGAPDPLDPTELWDEEEPSELDVMLIAAGEYEGSHDWTFAGQLAEKGVVIDHDPVKYAPYQWLVDLGHPDGYPECFLVGMG